MQPFSLSKPLFSSMTSSGAATACLVHTLQLRGAPQAVRTSLLGPSNHTSQQQRHLRPFKGLARRSGIHLRYMKHILKLIGHRSPQPRCHGAPHSSTQSSGHLHRFKDAPPCLCSLQVLQASELSQGDPQILPQSHHSTSTRLILARILKLQVESSSTWRPSRPSCAFRFGEVPLVAALLHLRLPPQLPRNRGAPRPCGTSASTARTRGT